MAKFWSFTIGMSGFELNLGNVPSGSQRLLRTKKRPLEAQAFGKLGISILLRMLNGATLLLQDTFMRENERDTLCNTLQYTLLVSPLAPKEVAY